MTIDATMKDRPNAESEPSAPPPDRKANVPIVKTARPNMPNTTLGTLASVSSPIRTILVINQRSFMYSAR